MWLEVDWNLCPSGYKAQSIPLHHCVPQYSMIKDKPETGRHLQMLCSVKRHFPSLDVLELVVPSHLQSLEKIHQSLIP